MEQKTRTSLSLGGGKRVSVQLFEGKMNDWGDQKGKSYLVDGRGESSGALVPAEDP